MKYFGTDGVRGVFGGDVLTLDFARRIGQAYGEYLRDSFDAPNVLIARDTRESGAAIETAIASGLTKTGVNVTTAGIMPTPAHTFDTKEMAFSGGIMITASHNPAEHNGIKFCDGEGNKLSLDVQAALEIRVDAIAEQEEAGIETLQYNEPGKVTRGTGYDKLWADAIVDILGNPDLSGFKVALDLANGAGCYIIPEIFRACGAEVFAFNTEDDGKNINNGCGSTHIENFVQSCLDVGADVGFSFDGDADRIMCVARDGTILDGTDFMYIFGVNYAQNGKLNGNTVVSTIATNTGLKKSLATLGINYVATKVGGQYVQAEMAEHGYVVGGEENGHMMLGDIGEGSDGMCIGLYLMKIMKGSGQDLTELNKGLKRALLAKADMHVTAEQKAKVNEGAIDEMVNELQASLGDSGRILVRTSGTECVVRILVEGEVQEEIDEIRDELVRKVNSL